MVYHHVVASPADVKEESLADDVCSTGARRSPSPACPVDSSVSNNNNNNNTIMAAGRLERSGSDQSAVTPSPAASLPALSADRPLSAEHRHGAVSTERPLTGPREIRAPTSTTPCGALPAGFATLFPALQQHRPSQLPTNSLGGTSAVPPPTGLPPSVADYMSALSTNSYLLNIAQRFQFMAPPYTSAAGDITKCMSAAALASMQQQQQQPAPRASVQHLQAQFQLAAAASAMQKRAGAALSDTASPPEAKRSRAAGGADSACPSPTSVLSTCPMCLERLPAESADAAEHLRAEKAALDRQLSEQLCVSGDCSSTAVTPTDLSIGGAKNHADSVSPDACANKMGTQQKSFAGRLQLFDKIRANQRARFQGVFGFRQSCGAVEQPRSNGHASASASPAPVVQCRQCRAAATWLKAHAACPHLLCAPCWKIRFEKESYSCPVCDENVSPADLHDVTIG